MRLKSRTPMVVRLIAAMGALVVWPHTVNAASPALQLVEPRGGQRGAEVVVTLHGQRLGDAHEILFYSPGIEVSDLRVENNTKLIATLAISPDCALGLHALRVRTATGISTLQTFSVGALVEITETEPNNSFDSAQAIDLDVTINGVANNEDVDYYVVEVAQGEKLTAEIEGLRISTAPFDPYVAIFDEARFELASCDDAALLRQDAVASVVAPNDGRYFIAVRESAYRGNGNCRYRLHVGRFPRPTATVPSSAKPGEDLPVRLLGEPGRSREMDLAVPTASSANASTAGWIGPGIIGLHIADDHGIAPSPNFFRVSEYDTVVEAEGNNNHRDATVFSAPATLCGVIGEIGDRDLFAFAATSGQTFEIAVYARRLRSPLDSVIGISHRGGKYLSGNDDDGGPDSRVRFTAPAKGEYVITIRDHLNAGGQDFAYCIEVAAPRTSVSVHAPRNQQAIAVPAGNRAAIMLTAERINFGGPLVLAATELPSGVTAHIPDVHDNVSVVPVVFEAAADAAPSSGLARVDVRHADATRDITGGFRQDVELVLGRNNVVFWAQSVDRLPVAVAEAAPFSIQVNEPKAPLVRNGQMQLRVIAKRDEGFTGTIRLRVPFRPPGVGASNSITIPGDQTEAHIPVNANGNAPLGEWKLVVTADAPAPGGGSYSISSSLFGLTIASPFLAFTPQATTVEQGQETTMHVAVARLAELEGPVTVELARLPHHVTADPVLLTTDASDLTFTIKTQADSPPGQHRGLFCLARCTRNGEPVVHRLPAGELRIDKPLPPAIAAAAPPEPKPQEQPPTERPLTRLEKLRRQHEQHGQSAPPAQESQDGQS